MGWSVATEERRGEVSTGYPTFRLKLPGTLTQGTPVRRINRDNQQQILCNTTPFRYNPITAHTEQNFSSALPDIRTFHRVSIYYCVLVFPSEEFSSMIGSCSVQPRCVCFRGSIICSNCLYVRRFWCILFQILPVE